MKLRASIFTLVLVTLIALVPLLPGTSSAPVPVQKEKENAIEEEDGVLLLVPTMRVDGKGQPSKREVDYELISIPSDIIRRTVREITQTYGSPSSTSISSSTDSNKGGSIYISDLNSGDDDEIIIKPSGGSSSYSRGGSSSSSESYSGGGKLNVISTVDLSKILSSVASAGLSAATTGASFAGQAKNVLSVGTSAVVGGTQAVKWVLQKKASGLRTAAELTGTGLQYAGRLSSAVLKVLLRVPGIKAKVISDLIVAGQPLATAVSEVISESADDLGDILLAQTDIFRDAVNVLFKLVQDVLSLKGRVIASFSAGGLDKGTNLISAGVKVGSAFVQTAGDVVSAVGRGVGEIVKVASEVNLPPPPALPAIKFPILPSISFPTKTYGTGHSSETYSAPKESSESYSSKGVTIKTSYGSPL